MSKNKNSGVQKRLFEIWKVKRENLILAIGLAVMTCCIILAVIVGDFPWKEVLESVVVSIGLLGLTLGFAVVWLQLMITAIRFTNRKVMMNRNLQTILCSVLFFIGWLILFIVVVSQYGPRINEEELITVRMRYIFVYCVMSFIVCLMSFNELLAVLRNHGEQETESNSKPKGLSASFLVWVITMGIASCLCYIFTEFDDGMEIVDLVINIIVSLFMPVCIAVFGIVWYFIISRIGKFIFGKVMIEPKVFKSVYILYFIGWVLMFIFAVYPGFVLDFVLQPLYGEILCIESIVYIVYYLYRIMALEPVVNIERSVVSKDVKEEIID